MADKTREGLIEEINLLKKRIAELEGSDSERKQQQQQQQQQQMRRLATVVRDSNDAITIQDFEGNITAWNRGAELMYGYSEGEALQMNFELLMPPDKLAEQKEFTRRIIAGEAITSFETQRKAKDGRILDVWLTVTKLVDDTGKPIGIASTGRDITERKLLQETLQESEERYRRLFETAQDGLLIVQKREADILNANASVQKLLGYSHEELLKKKLWEIGVVKDDRDFQETASKLESEGVVHHEAVPIKTKKGLDINSEVFLVNKTNFIQCNIRDITERKKAEEALRESEEKYRLITENTSDLITVLKLNGVFSYVSPSHSQLGYEPEELLGKSGIDMIHSFDRIKLLPLLLKYAKFKFADFFRLKQEAVVEYLEFRFPDKSGKWHYLESTANLMQSTAEKELKILLISRDVSERKKLEAELKERMQQLVQSSKLAGLGELVSKMAHEVNNPLMIISGNAQLLLMEELKDKKLEEGLKIIINQSDRAKQIIQRLLMFSKPSKGETKDIDVNACLNSVVKLMEHQYSLFNVSIVKNFASSLPVIKADEKQIQQVFMNLLNNSFDAMPNGGTITISTLREADSLRIDFADTGAGIPEENLIRLFEPFFTTKPKGTGLGLAVCYGIIKAHGGNIRYESEVGRGTTATLLLPIGGGKREA